MASVRHVGVCCYQYFWKIGKHSAWGRFWICVSLINKNANKNVWLCWVYDAQGCSQIFSHTFMNSLRQLRLALGPYCNCCQKTLMITFSKTLLITMRQLVHYQHAIVVSNQKCMFSPALLPLHMHTNPPPPKKESKEDSNWGLRQFQPSAHQIKSNLTYDWLKVYYLSDASANSVDLQNLNFTFRPIFKWDKKSSGEIKNLQVR